VNVGLVIIPTGIHSGLAEACALDWRRALLKADSWNGAVNVYNADGRKLDFASIFQQ
jgi:hypothetical protein